MLTIGKMDGEFLNGRVEMFTKGSTLKISEMALEKWPGLMEVFIEAYGLEVSNKV